MSLRRSLFAALTVAAAATGYLLAAALAPPPACAAPKCPPRPTVTVTTTQPGSTVITTETVTVTAPPATTEPTITATPPPPASGLLGTSSHTLSSGEIQHLRDAAGAVWYRDDALWEAIEPTQGVRNWARLDGLFANARAAGVNVLLIVDYAPGWAGRPPTASAYADFAAAAAGRYHGFGGQLALELWNEPYMPTTYIAPVAYAALARAAATAVHALGIGVTVGANVDVRNYTNGSFYFQDVLNADPMLATVIDFWSTHPYAGNCGPYATDQTCPTLGQDWRFDRVPKLQAFASSHGAARPWWLTEFGWSTSTGGVSEETQAAFTADAIRRARDEWGVQRLFVYTGDRDGSDRSDREANFGMRRSDGSDKPVVAAVRSAQ